MYKTILVPLDGSKRAEAILPHVEELAQRYGAKIIFLQIVEDILLVGHIEAVDISKYEEEHDRRISEAELYLAGVGGEFKEKNISVKQIVSHGGAIVQSILDAAEREGVGLIAMASHGRSGLARVFYGSVTAGILQRVDRPLLIIRSRGVE